MWLSGRASPCQGEGREFESRHPLQQTTAPSTGAIVVSEGVSDGSVRGASRMPKRQR